VAACASTPAPVTPPSSASASPPAAAAVVDSTPVTPAPPAEPTVEEKKKAEQGQQLKDDRAKWQEANKAELARWTPELHAEAKAFATKKFASGKAAIQAATLGKFRVPGDAARDKYRHPVETLEFFGFKPTQTVLDIGPGEGWYTELLAPALAKSGQYIATNADPNGPADDRATLSGEKFKGFLDKSPELFGKAQTIVVDSKAPKLGLDGTVDLVIVMRGVHGMETSGTFDAWLAEIHSALKPGGVFGLEEHRAPEGADPAASAKNGYVPEKWLIEKVESVGFKLAGKSEVNANPKDTKDYAEGVWALPPTLRGGDKDREKLVAIGESDRMTLKFVKPAAKPAPPDKADKAAKTAK
jgi:predicted methyltransferase